MKPVFSTSFLCSRRAVLQAAVSALLATPAAATAGIRHGVPSDRVAQRIQPPHGYQRAPVAVQSFTDWLRELPLQPPGSPVLLYTGALKGRQDAHAAVIDIDVGARDLQQCADAVMRLRAEWQFASGRQRSIVFSDTGEGKPMEWIRWAAGERPRLNGRSLIWERRSAPDPSYGSFRRYLDTVFTWAGTYSLERELIPVSVSDAAAGDVLIQGGFPGHAVLVVDLAIQPQTGDRLMLLAQSYMPAQSIHLLNNLSDPPLSPWYRLTAGAPVQTPDWTFPPDRLRRWRN